MNGKEYFGLILRYYNCGIFVSLVTETSENVAKKSCVRDKSDSESSSDDSTFSSISQTKVSAPIDEVATIVDIGSFNEELGKNLK